MSLTGPQGMAAATRKSIHSSQLFCANADSGETIWASEGSFARHVTLLVGGEHLITLTDKGTLIFIKSDSGSYQPLASYKLSDSRTWAHPLVSGKRIVIKDETGLTCWSLGPEG